MDVPSLVITIFSAAEQLLQRCEEVNQCHREAMRLELRIRNLVSTLESAAGAFSGDITFQRKLVELHAFLMRLPPILDKAKKPTKLVARAKHFAKASALAHTLQKEEAALGTLCDDLGLAMLPAIAEKMKLVPNEVEARVSAAVGDMLREQTDQILGRMLDPPGEDTSRAQERSSGRRQGSICWDALVESDRVLGEGSFGEVVAGTYFGRDVAIKKAKLSTLPREAEMDFR